MSVPLLVTSMEPNSDFSELCETLVVSAHGCALQSSTRLDAGAPVYFQSKQGRRTRAHIVDCQPLNSGKQGWKLAAMLDQPQNFWGLEKCPDDWVRWISSVSSDQMPPRHGAVPDDDIRSLIAELVQPLHAEVAELQHKLANGQAKRSQFDISLSHIPPEVEEKLWIRLRQDLGEQALRQTREQSQRVLEAAEEAIEEKINKAQDEFRQNMIRELQKVEEKTRSLSDQIAATLQEHLNSRIARFQQQVAEAGVHLERHNEELLRGVQQRLGDEHEVYRKEMQEIQEGAAADASRLHGEVAELDTRIGKLDQTALRLENDLDTRLTRMANGIISGARTQLESAVDIVLKELGTRNAKELDRQLEAASGRLKTTQKQIEVSVSDLIKTEVAGSLLSFGQTMEELAQDSVGRWRLALAKDLTSVAKTLGQEFRTDPLPQARSND